MEKRELEEIVERVLTWPEEDQKKVVRFVDALEEWEAEGDVDFGVEAAAH